MSLSADRPRPAAPESATHGRLALLFRLRWVLAAGCAGLALAGLAGTHLPVTGPALVALALLGANLATWLALRRRRAGWLAPRGLFLQLFGDTLALSVLVQQTGGLASPVVGAYLVPIALGANLLPRRGCWGVFVCVVASYSMQALLPRRLPHVHGVDSFDLHQAGMWLTVVAAAALLAGFLARSADLLRCCERELAAARETVLAQERLVALAALASTTAHELATPLATMRITVDDLADDASLSPAQRGDVAALGQQLSRCRDALAALMREAGAARGEAARRVFLSDWLSEIAEQWRVRRPEVAVRIDCASTQALVAEQGLGHTLHCLLDRAATASVTALELAAQVGGDTLRLAVRGDMPAANGSASAAWPDPTQGADPPGHATITQLGGRLDARPRSGGGTEFVITLPLAALRS